MAEVLKVEIEGELCCICGNSGLDLLTPEEHDANSAALHVPLRTMLMQLNNNKIVPEGRLCQGCASRAADAYEFSSALNSRCAPPLSEKIRALRRRLHELTQKIDVFIVVGGPGAGGAGGTNAYSEDDIIMVEKEALAAATAADNDELEHAKNARGDSVYQCTVCPMSFQRVSELRAHTATHPADSLHSCWTCGAQFPTRDALSEHAQQHAVTNARSCALCQGSFSTRSEMRRHEAECEARCPACGSVFVSRSELSAHAAANHGRGSHPPLVCAACFLTFPTAELLSAHQLRHRQAKQFVCGYGDCVLRFGTRSNLMAHIRKCHAAELPDEPTPENNLEFSCDQCERSFASGAALKRHQRAHSRAQRYQHEDQQEAVGEMETDEAMEQVQYVIQEGGQFADGEEGEVEYLEVETLEDAEYILEEVEEEADTKPDISRLQ